jgi:HlyD family secretion protein
MTQSKRRIGFWVILLGMVAAGLVYALRPQPVPVDLVTVARGPMMVTLDEEGETRVKDVYTLSAPLTGRALRIEAEVGDAVTAGQTVLARIEPIDPAFLDVRSLASAQATVDTAVAAKSFAAAELERAQAELSYAASEYQRAQGLVRGETISERSYDQAVLNFRAAKAAVATAEAALRMRDAELTKAKAQLLSPVTTIEARAACECVSITAPVSGRILSILHKSEGVVQAGQALLEIGDPTAIEVVADLLSSEAVQATPGHRVLIEDWGGTTDLTGEVERIEPVGFTKVSALGIEEQRVNVVIGLTGGAETWARLGHGYRVEVRVVLWEDGGVLKLPLSALFRDGNQWAVFVGEDGFARRRTVRLGHRNDRDAEILEGLEEGDAVVSHPSDRISDGVRIVSRN